MLEYAARRGHNQELDATNAISYKRTMTTTVLEHAENADTMHVKISDYTAERSRNLILTLSQHQREENSKERCMRCRHFCSAQPQHMQRRKYNSVQLALF